MDTPQSSPTPLSLEEVNDTSETVQEDTSTQSLQNATQEVQTTAQTTMSYARARLYLGVSGVGTWVVIAALALLFRLPERILSTQVSWSLTNVTQLLTVILLYAFIQGAFDLFGGFVLPKEYGRYTPSLAGFVGHWFRGAALHGAVLLVVGLALLAAARLGGFALALLVFVLLSIGLVYGQILLARLLGGLGTERKDGVLLLRSPYPHLTGGVAGLLKPVVAVPKAWEERFSPQTFNLLVKRKEKLIEKGSRRTGLAAALLWNTAGFVLAYLLAGGTASVAGLVNFSLWSTLWAFVGVLVLPTLSRRAVFQGDALAVSSGQEVTLLTDALKALDRDQDDEFRRRQGVETVFHPIPSVARRIERLEVRDAPPRLATWHVARTTLYLSWANLSFLSRAVHCNVGRPEVWVFLPSD